jgi:UbiA prenyltransferase family/Sulfotransferase family
MMKQQRYRRVASCWEWLRFKSGPASATLDDDVLLRGPDGVDRTWYRKTYPDIGSMDPVDHYARAGWRERRSPNEWFSTTWYLQNNPDVLAAEANPLLHFLREGRKQGRFSAPHEFWNPLAWLSGPGGVDAGWYRRTYRLDRSTNAAAHYAERGWREGKDPNPDFSTGWYLESNSDVAAAGTNPLLHYLERGRSEGRRPKPTLVETPPVPGWWWKLVPIGVLARVDASRPGKQRLEGHGGDDDILLRGPDGVDPTWYRKTYPDIGSEMDPADHYANGGWREGRSPNERFSTAWYLQNNPDVVAAGANPLLHFLREGREQGRISAPHEFWNPLAWLNGPGGVDADWYLRTYRLDRGTNAAAHYAERGWREGKDPSPDFSTGWYLGSHPDVAAAGANPLLHYLERGRNEGRRPKPALLETLRVAGWWWKLAPIATAIYATAYQLKVSLLSLTPLLLLAFAAVAVQATYVSLINDLSDRSEDLASGKRNGLFGRASTTIAMMLGCCIVPGALFAFHWRHDPLLAGLYLAGWAAFSAYSLPPLRLKARGIWGVIADASGAHLLPALFGVVLVYHWQAVPIDPAWFTVVAVWSFCYGLRGILWHQLIDRDQDTTAGVRTFVERHSLETLRRVAHVIVFPCEVAALVCMLWLTGSVFAAAFFALYLLWRWRRTWQLAPPVIVLPSEGKATFEVEHRLALFEYYEFFLPLTFLLASSLRYPADLLVILAYVLILPPRTFLKDVARRIASFTAPEAEPAGQAGEADTAPRSDLSGHDAHAGTEMRAIGHLIHIGYAKTGSNILRRWMSAHPQLQYAGTGIAGFRDVLQIASDSAAPRRGVLYRVTSYEGLAQPHAYAGAERVDYERVKSTSMGNAQAQACATLAALFPTAHVLLVTRGFRSMILSSYSQYVRTGGQASLWEAIEGAKDAWDYDYLVRLYSEAFGDRLIVMPYELLREDLQAFTREVEARLGLKHFTITVDRVNPALSPVELAWYPRLTRLVRSLPVGDIIRSRLYDLHVRAMLANRYGGLAAMLQRVHPIRTITADVLKDETLNAFAGKAERLRDNPLFAPYRSDYLL